MTAVALSRRTFRKIGTFYLLTLMVGNVRSAKNGGILSEKIVVLV